VKTILITGSTRGIGYGLAKSFLEMGHRVMVNGRSQDGMGKALAKLGEVVPTEHVFGKVGDVRDYEQVQGLWDAAVNHFGSVDIWINNAGLGTRQSDFWALPPKRIDEVVGTNVIGLMYGCHVALWGMLEQGHGAIYNMEGLGSDGRYIEGLILYGSTKRAVHYLTGGLVDEVKGTPVIVGSLSPGMVITDLITGQYEGREEEWQDAKGIFNILADRVETVTPWLAEQVIANRKNGTRIRWLTRGKVIWRFLRAPFVKRDLFEGGDVS
jgi:NADP-dependent 3-hydroxy acid dehydrogenase YdfG